MKAVHASADDIQQLSNLWLLSGILIAPLVENHHGAQPARQSVTAKDITDVIVIRDLLNNREGISQLQLENALLQLNYKKDSSDPVVLNDLGCVLALLGRHSEAHDTLAKAELEVDLRWQAARDAMQIPNIVEEAAVTLAQSAQDLQDPQTTKEVLEILQYTEQRLRRETRALQSVRQDDIIITIQHNRVIVERILDNAKTRQAKWGKVGAGTGSKYAKAMRYVGARREWFLQVVISLLALAGLGVIGYAIHFIPSTGPTELAHSAFLFTGLILLGGTLLVSLLSDRLRPGVLPTGALLLIAAIILALIMPPLPTAPSPASAVYSLPAAQIRSDLSALSSGTPVEIILDNSGQEYSFKASIYQVSPASTPMPCYLGTPVSSPPAATPTVAAPATTTPASAPTPTPVVTATPVPTTECLNTSLAAVSITLADPGQVSTFMDQLNSTTIIYVQPG